MSNIAIFAKRTIVAHQNARKGSICPDVLLGHVRAVPAVWRGKYATAGATTAKSNVWARCKQCGGLSKHGICLSCGFGTVCAWCGRVKQPDGVTWAKMPRANVAGYMSHGICQMCYTTAMSVGH